MVISEPANPKSPNSPPSMVISEPENPKTPISPPQPQESTPINLCEVTPEENSIQPDPLLGSGAFIDADRSESGANTPVHLPFDSSANAEFPAGTVIDAKPISMVAPAPESTPRVSIRKSREEMSKRPDWLPEDWKMDLRVRTSGATAGTFDRYYIEPSGQSKFRSKNEVLHFLATGSKVPKKRDSDTATSDAATSDAGPSASPASSKLKKCSAKRKKTES